MERESSPKLPTKNHSKFSDTLQKQATPHGAQFKQPPVSDTHVQRNGRSRRESFKYGRFRTSGSESQFRFPNIFETQKRRHCTADIQPKTVKQIYTHKKMSTVEHPKNTQFSTDKRLACKNRFIERLLPFASSHVSQTFFEGNLQKPAFTNNLSPVRTSLRSTNFCIPIELGSSNIAGEGYPNNCLLGRLSDSSSEPVNLDQACGDSSKNFRTPWVESKLFKISSAASDHNSIPGNCLGSTSKRETITTPKSCRGSQKNSNPVKKENCQFDRNTEHSRIPEFCKFSSPKRQVELSRSSAPVQSTIAKKSEITLPYPEFSPSGPKLVAHQSGQAFMHTLPDSIRFPGNGRVGDRLGRSTEQHNFIGYMDSSGESVTFQSKRDDGYSLCVKKSRSLPGRFKPISAKRQQVCSFISKTRRGHEIEQPHENDSGNIRFIGSAQNSFRGSLPSGPIQRRSRSLVSVRTDTGVAPFTRHNNHNFSKVGHASYRSVCFRSRSCSPHIRHPGLIRSQCVFSRCFQPRVGLPFGLGFSASISGAEGTATSKFSQRCIPDSRTSLGQGVLETRFEKQSPRCTTHDPQPGPSPCGRDNEQHSSDVIRHGPGSMEMWGWEENLKGWTKEQKDLLLEGWRSSSLKTYNVAWKKWQLWTRQNSVDLFHPNGSDLAKFLIDLYQIQGLAYSTILVYKSAISTLTDPNLDNRLSSHILVKQALKSIRARSVQKIKAPIWDTDCLITWLKNNTPNENSLFDCSGRAAILLLLCSGRRVHDLTLLTLDEGSCIVSENSVVFWPKFGSKTDTVTHRQSGWRLLQNLENTAIDPVFWIKKVISLSQDRRALCSDKHLFLTTCGPPKAASRTNIAGWIRKILSKAGIRASAGSVRPAVASKNWVENCPLDEILSRGNWRSENTFLKFYCREIQTSQGSKGISNLFKPIAD